MKSLKGKMLIAIGALLLMFVAIISLLPRPADPIHDGKHESEWFGDLCRPYIPNDPNIPTKKFFAAVDAFGHMGPEFVPYLTNQMRYDRSGFLEQPLTALQNFGPTFKYFSSIIRPSHRREEAALALLNMGPQADKAIPALLEAWAKDRPNIKECAIDALDSILPNDPISEGDVTYIVSGPHNRMRKDDVILREALKRYPGAAVYFKDSIKNAK